VRDEADDGGPPVTVRVPEGMHVEGWRTADTVRETGGGAGGGGRERGSVG
jgi:hypothetical protein